MQLAKNTSEISGGTQYDEAKTVTIPTMSATDKLRLRVYISINTVCENVTFYPMIRPASIQDDTYVPYGMSNAELTEKVAPISVKTEYLGASSTGEHTYSLTSGRTYFVIVSKINSTVKDSNSAFIVVPYTTAGRETLTSIVNNTSYVEASISQTTLTLTTKADYMSVMIMEITT